jgi:L-asparaginase/Glu-tRNA(Gln) amidotransferase subunit D
MCGSGHIDRWSTAVVPFLDESHLGVCSVARLRGVQFFCTSQQEGIVDFAGYVISHELWREGAVPMGALTTESAYTRLLAALLVSAGEPGAARRF